MSAASKKRSAPEDSNINTSPKKQVKKALPKARKCPPPAQPVITRPSRNRKAPERYVEIKQSPKPAPTPRPKPTGTRIYEPYYATTHSKSRLVDANVYKMLLEPASWTCLSADDQATIIAMLPPTPANKTLHGLTTSGADSVERPKELHLPSDVLRTDIARYQNDLSWGFMGSSWLAKAQTAMQERADGLFDAWKAEEAERWWGQGREY
ncbi:hypothetical protein P154DRAFT_430881 [Amniculicola lignicola CBS 123094]|uniref:ASX DEUBAD domain-containing protein n=1 Tax=Amniculicola lignicola CBS 123094 TaxID=1392246 RepID=A0A6A5WP37_9PLEO|nr:hypothetical protein P154DRAFT_430881 [Amniculicola lignicola CBS 123094]